MRKWTELSRGIREAHFPVWQERLHFPTWFLCTGSHDFGKEGFDLITEPINISDDSWICAQAFVGPGANIPKKTMLRGATWTGGHNPN